jgi:hypothetical protein
MRQTVLAEEEEVVTLLGSYPLAEAWELSLWLAWPDWWELWLWCCK